MLYAVDLCRTLSVCCESFCMLSLIAVGGLGLFNFFFLSSMELWLQMEAYVGLFCSTFFTHFWCSNAFTIGSCGGIRVIWARP